MKHLDTIVIGGGLAGLFAALVAAKRGQKVMLLTYGAGTFSLNSGVIDVLAYDGEHRYLASPREGLKGLPTEHPYSKIGLEYIEKSLRFFLDVTKENGMPYCGDLSRQIKVPTAAGTLKPTCLAPKFMDGAALKSADKIVVVTVKGLKDFYGNIIVNNLPKVLGDKKYERLEFDTGLTGGRDITALDGARLLDTQEGRTKLTAALKGKAYGNALFLLPPILGTKGDEAATAISGELGTPVLETTCLPPSVNGFRLQNLLKTAVKKLGAEIVENCRVLGGAVRSQKCSAVTVQATAREKNFAADKFILATGGFYSGGIVMRDFANPRETVFDLPVYFIPGEENWSNRELFSDKPQGFARTGIMTNEHLQPTDKAGRVALKNVYVAGRNLAAYDFCFEHSGNGVALASAYKAAME